MNIDGPKVNEEGQEDCEMGPAIRRKMVSGRKKKDMSLDREACARSWRDRCYTNLSIVMSNNIVKTVD